MSDRSRESAARARLHLVTGKGGVGKTTICAALAVEARRAGRRPVIVELGHESSLAHVLDLAPDRIGHEPREVLPGIAASNVALDAALVDYLARRVRSRTIARRVVASAPLTSFFEAAPAVPELLALEHIEALLARFDPVIVDLDATGHALMFLELPRLLAEIAPRGPIGELVRSLATLLTDSARTRVHLVTLPMSLPIEETLELHAALTDRGSPIGTIVINRRAHRPLAPEDDARASALLAQTDDHDARDALELLLADAAIWDREEASLARLDALHAPRLVLRREPLDDRARLSSDSLARLGRACAAVLS